MSITVAVCTSVQPACPYNTCSTASGHSWLVRKHRSGKFTIKQLGNCLSQKGDWLPSSLQWMKSTTKNIILYCLWERKAHHESQTELLSHSPYHEIQWGRSDSSRVSLAGEDSNLLHLFWGHFKDLTSTVGADGNCLGQWLQTNCKESTGKIFHCVKGRIGNQPFQATWWRMETQKGPHSTI